MVHKPKRIFVQLGCFLCHQGNRPGSRCFRDSKHPEDIADDLQECPPQWGSSNPVHMESKRDLYSYPRLEFHTSHMDMVCK